MSARVPVPPSPASALRSAPQGCCGDMPAMVADAQQNALRALRRAVRCAGRLAVLDGSAPRLLEAGSGEDAEDSVDAGALVSSPPCPEGVTGGGGSATRVPDPVSRFCSKTTRTLNRFAVRPGRFRPSRPVWGLGLCSQAAGPRLQRAQPCGRGAGARAGLAAASPARGVTEPRLALPRVTASGVTRGI